MSDAHLNAALGGGLYDCVVANPGVMNGHKMGRQTHQEFVMFELAQAYPSFVVQYVDC